MEIKEVKVELEMSKLMEIAGRLSRRAPWQWREDISQQILMLNHNARSNIYRILLVVINELLGMDIQHSQYKVLMSGFDNRIFQVDRDQFRLGSRAMELGLATLFEAVGDDEKLLLELEKSEAGRKWLDEFRQLARRKRLADDTSA